MWNKLLFTLLLLLTIITIYLYTTVYERLLRTTDTNDYVANVPLLFPLMNSGSLQRTLLSNFVNSFNSMEYESVE
jgi:hypothetical protein